MPWPPSYTQRSAQCLAGGRAHKSVWDEGAGSQACTGHHTPLPTPLQSGSLFPECPLPPGLHASTIIVPREGYLLVSIPWKKDSERLSTHQVQSTEKCSHIVQRTNLEVGAVSMKSNKGQSNRCSLQRAPFLGSSPQAPTLSLVLSLVGRCTLTSHSQAVS